LLHDPFATTYVSVLKYKSKTAYFSQILSLYIIFTCRGKAALLLPT